MTALNLEVQRWRDAQTVLIAVDWSNHVVIFLSDGVYDKPHYHIEIDRPDLRRWNDAPTYGEAVNLAQRTIDAQAITAAKELLAGRC